MIIDEGALKTLIEDVVRKVLREELGRSRNDSPEFISVAEAARRIDVAPGTIREWVGQGRLGRYHAGRELRIRVSDLSVLVTNCPLNRSCPLRRRQGVTWLGRLTRG